MTKTKAKAIASEILAILVAIAIIVVVVVWLRQTYSATNQTNEVSCVVVDCQHNNGNGLYVVTVESHDGNLWDYYSDVPKVRGYIVKLVFNGNEIIDVEE